MAANHPNLHIVDDFQLNEALFADPRSFGFIDPLTVPWVNLLAAHSTQFAPNEVAFFDQIHPSAAAHGILAAFADAVLTSDHVQFLDGTQTTIHAQDGDNFIFATNDLIHPVVNDNYTIYGGSGRDLIFAGPGNVTVYGGSGSDLIAAGSGNAKLVAGDGTDVLATNSLGTNVLVGGHGEDALYLVGSADLMQRNLDRRVEVLVPVGDPVLQRRLDEIFDVLESDDVLAWELEGTGGWHPQNGAGAVDAQTTFQDLALARARGMTTVQAAPRPR
jgi:Ca2+-binding RTX toxin-like protein